jgi:hypothetical protein
MKKITVLLAILGFVFICMESCYYDVEEELYPGTACDTTNVSYSNTVFSILETQCLNCHNNANSSVLGAGIDLEGYTQLKTYVDNGKFLSSITHDGNASFMPKSANNTKLPDCDIAKITAWINAGAPNN